MRIAVTIAGAEALQSAFVVWRGFEESILKAADYGYDGVELALKSVDEIHPDRLDGWLKRAGISVSSISTGQFFAERGLCFTSPEADVRKRTVVEFRELIRLAKDFGGIVNIGRIRGSIHPGQTLGEAQQLFIDSLLSLADEAEQNHVIIVVEPVNRYEINYINNLDQGSALLDAMQRSCMGLMPDVFHMNIEDDDLPVSILRNARWIRYVHFADSNRRSPGDGHTDFGMILNALREIGYEGWTTLEILPEPNPDAAARRGITYLRERFSMFYT